MVWLRDGERVRKREDRRKMNSVEVGGWKSPGSPSVRYRGDTLCLGRRFGNGRCCHARYCRGAFIFGASISDWSGQQCDECFYGYATWRRDCRLVPPSSDRAGSGIDPGRSWPRISIFRELERDSPVEPFMFFLLRTHRDCGFLFSCHLFSLWAKVSPTANKSRLSSHPADSKGRGRVLLRPRESSGLRSRRPHFDISCVRFAVAIGAEHSSESLVIYSR